MVYGTIETVRNLSGNRPQKAYGVSIGTGDNSETEFLLPYVGLNEGYILDQSEQTSATPTILVAPADVTVYVDEVPVTVSSVDPEKGSVTLASAPADAGDVTADYWHSVISDESVIVSMNDAKNIVDEIIDGDLESNHADEFKYDGDGYQSEFWLQKKDVTAITSVTVNSSTKTLGTDYYIYYFDDGVRMAYIKFKSPPSASSLQNVVIGVTRGRSKSILTRLSNLHAGKLILLELPDSAIVGEFKKGSPSTGKIPTTSRLRMLNMQIKDILETEDGRDILGI
jgi:hypothetical protein